MTLEPPLHRPSRNRILGAPTCLLFKTGHFSPTKLWTAEDCLRVPWGPKAEISRSMTQPRETNSQVGPHDRPLSQTTRTICLSVHMASRLTDVASDQPRGGGGHWPGPPCHAYSHLLPSVSLAKAKFVTRVGGLVGKLS